MKNIFIVDDSAVNLTMARQALEKDYQVFTMPSAEKMFSILEKVMPDLILLDIEMPEMSGMDALQKLKKDEHTAKIPVVFLTASMEDSTEALGLKLGAVDFITKPYSEEVLINRITHHLHIEEQILKQTRQLERLQDGILSVVADMVENRDKVTGWHVERTTEYVRILVEAMLKRGVYADEIHRWDIKKFISSARLHDVGKIVISDLILNKPGKLTEEEFNIIKTHTTEGERIVDMIITRTGEETFLRHAKLLASSHHEQWDGSGYPRGLKETDIPLQGRIMAIADVYDALVSVRPYKKAFECEEAVKIIMDGKGKQFDPHIAEVFFEVKDEFQKVFAHSCK
ncbi:MAG: response regulator [Fibromonadaceae bacterium]|jgi:putative two-component system response regulator|nr:response regulator [Fibromonadaceae bacterium]